MMLLCFYDMMSLVVLLARIVDVVSYAKPKPSPPSLIASKSCCRSISYDEYCGRSIWLKPANICESMSQDVAVGQHTCVRLWETIGVAVRPMDGESLDTLDTLELGEAAEGYSRGTSSEAQYLGPLFSVERLQSTPPPDDDWIRTRVSVVLSRSTPFVNIDIRSTRDEQFKLLLVELWEECILVTRHLHVLTQNLRWR